MLTNFSISCFLVIFYTKFCYKQCACNYLCLYDSLSGRSRTRWGTLASNFTHSFSVVEIVAHSSKVLTHDVQHFLELKYEDYKIITILRKVCTCINRVLRFVFCVLFFWFELYTFSLISQNFSWYCSNFDQYWWCGCLGITLLLDVAKSSIIHLKCEVFWSKLGEKS